jgi:RNA polymerase sigma-70 factor (ECF subfamily)
MDRLEDAAVKSLEYAGEGARPLRAGADAQLPLNDPERLGALLHSLEPRLSAVAVGVTRDPDAAQDVLQNAFEKVLRYGHRFRGQSRVSTWMHRIVANEALMWLRSQRRRREDPLDDEPDFALATTARRSTADEAEWAQQVDRLRNGLESLPTEELEVVRGCALAGESYAEFSRRTGVHPAAAKSRAFRARRRLGKLLEE